MRRKIWFSCLFVLSFAGLFWVLMQDPKLPTKKFPIHFYSNQQRSDLKILLLSALKEASRSIYLQIYSLTDPDILALLQVKAETLPVTIFYDASASGALQKNLQAPHLYCYPVHTSGLMHRKILVIDEEKIYLGSTNFTEASLRIHDNLLIGLYHPALARFLIEATQDIFYSQTNPALSLFLLPDAEKQALTSLLSCLQNARHRLFLAQFSLSHPLIVEEIIQTKKRGVDVRLAIDARAAEASSQPALIRFAAEKIPVYLSCSKKLLHHKWALIDENTLLFGSVNWSKAGFRSNQDFLAIIKNLSGPQKNFMANLCSILMRSGELMDYDTSMSSGGPL